MNKMTLIKKPIAIVMFGPQASGKGTQALQLARHLNMKILSPGNLLHQARTKKDTTAKQIEKYYNQGKMVPNGIVIKLLRQKLDAMPLSNGVIFDGFPRTESQLASFNQMILKFNFTKIIGIHLDICESAVFKRVSLRKICSKCNKPFLPGQQAYKNNYCDECGGLLIKRADNTAEAIKQRLDIFYRETQPVINYFKKSYDFIDIDGELNIENVYQEIINGLKKIGIIQ